MNAAKIIDESLYFFRDNFIYLAIVIIPVTLVLAGLNYGIKFFFDENMQRIVDFPLYLAFISILYAGEILIVDKRANGKAVNFPDIFKESLNYWFPLFKLLFIKGFLIGIGFILFIVPGVLLMVRLSLAEQHLVLKDSGAIAALKQSYTITTPYFLTLLLSIGGFYVFPEVIEFLIKAYIEDIPVLLNFLLALIYMVFYTLPTIAAYRIYTLIPEHSNQNE